MPSEEKAPLQEGLLGWRLVWLEPGVPAPPPFNWLVSGRVKTPILLEHELVSHLRRLIAADFPDPEDPYHNLARRLWMHRFDPEAGVRVEWWTPQASDAPVVMWDPLLHEVPLRSITLPASRFLHGAK